MKKMFALAVGFAVGLMQSMVASATAIDVSAAVTNITDQVTPIGLIAAAVFTVIVAVATWRYVRRAL